MGGAVQLAQGQGIAVGLRQVAEHGPNTVSLDHPFDRLAGVLAVAVQLIFRGQ